MRAFVIGFRHKNIGGTTQVTVVSRGGINEFLRGGDAMFFQHDDEQFRFDNRTGEEQFHTKSLATDEHG